MDFDYNKIIGTPFIELEKAITKVVTEYNIDPEMALQLSWDLWSEVSTTLDEICLDVIPDIVSDVHYKLDDLNQMDDGELIDAIKADKDVFKYIFNPSSDVIDVYKFIYEL